MSKVKVILNRAGVGQLLKSAEMQAILREHAQNIVSKTNGEVKVFNAGTRAIATVDGDDGNNSLLKAMRK